MRKQKAIATALLAAMVLCTSAVPAFAADVAEGDTASATTSVTVIKENPAPVFTIGIPSAVTVTSAEAQSLTFTMSEDSLNAIPDGKKVSVTIADAGYGNTTGKFAVYNEDLGSEATYGVYGSKYSTRPSDAYEIGDLLVSFYGNEKVTDGEASIGRVVKVDNYDQLAAGNYHGTITFGIDVRQK